MSHRKTLAVAAASIIVGFLAFLAVSLLTSRGGEEPRIEYSTMVAETVKTEGRMKAFLETNPDGAHHIGDVIDIRIVAVFDPEVWEISDAVIRNFVPFPREFEVKSRNIKNFTKDGMAFLEAKWRVQCLECLEARYLIDFASNESPGIRAKDKISGKVSGLRLPAKYITFVPLPDNKYPERSLPRLPEENNQEHVFYFVLAGVSLVVLSGLTVYGRIKKTKGKSKTDDFLDDKFVLRVRELGEALTSVNSKEVGHSLNSLLLIFARERGKSKELDDLTSELSALVYSGEEVSLESLKSLIFRAEAYIAKGEA